MISDLVILILYKITSNKCKNKLAKLEMAKIINHQLHLHFHHILMLMEIFTKKQAKSQQKLNVKMENAKLLNVQMEFAKKFKISKLKV